ncbi:hypothetical protein BOS5A_230013 [Bosea sp. EC-HK365B]|nr:hypothetical protein BOSE21B_150041 [Bosea sp. 21B]CAD5300698.1 hypothetical protein BOSE7B_90069 [Bosea sp. 7B]VVT60736.1 hypothetical protein BOS5A_230013 [Bosea sp. EC-HK365B]VXC60127.1 hypothetical protein BOSE127_230041 [Bosea sp. 127]
MESADISGNGGMKWAIGGVAIFLLAALLLGLSTLVKTVFLHCPAITRQCTCSRLPGLRL